MPARGLVMAVYVPTALLAFGQGLLLATLPLYAADFNVSYTLISLAVAAAAIGTLITDVPAGALLGRIGLRRSMLMGAGLVAVSTFALVFGGSLEAVIAFRVAAGVGTALWGLSRHAYIAEAVPQSQRGRAISLFGGINRMGVFAGPAVGGLIGSTIDLRASFLLSALLAFTAFMLSLRYSRTVPSKETILPRRDRWALVGRLAQSHGRDLAAASVAQTFAQMIRAGRQFIIPVYGATVLDLNVAQIGAIMSIAALLDMAMFFPAGLLMDRFGRKVASVPSFGVMAAGVALIPFATSYTGLLAASVLIGFGNGLGSGSMMTLGADLAPRGATGEFLGMWRLVGDAGAVGGPLIVGVMATGVGLRGSAYVLAGIGVAATLTLALLVRETRQSPLEPAL
ncbi:MAG: MFS transporter [Chloroflexota bacterium]|nr:MFS transporter [Chloroflexota bacterium]